MKSYRSIFQIVLHGRSALKILLATIFSFTFSITVILCTFGLMDGFDFLLKSGLRYSSGDLFITNREGFFNYSEEIDEKIQIIKPLSVAPIIQTEAFLNFGDKSKGVLVKGVEKDSFTKTTGLKLDVTSGGVAIGKELASQFKLKVGEKVSLTFGRGNDTVETLPLIQSFRVTSIIEHGIYQKDLRFIYLDKKDLSELLALGDRVNYVIISTQPANVPLISLEDVEKDQKLLLSEFNFPFSIKPFWHEYDFLIKAVKVEKFSITLILQLIVVVALFNIVAFVIYIMEKKAQDFFLLRAIGLSIKEITRFWLFTIMFIWISSCTGATILAEIFNWSLGQLSVFQIPGEIYVLSSLKLKLGISAYFAVFGLSLIWIIIASMIGHLRIKRKPIVQGLRQEFSS